MQKEDVGIFSFLAFGNLMHRLISFKNFDFQHLTEKWHGHEKRNLQKPVHLHLIKHA